MRASIWSPIVIYKGEQGGSMSIQDSSIPVDLTPLKPKRYSCPYPRCSVDFESEELLVDHKIEFHPSKRPFMYIFNRLIYSSEFIVTSQLNGTDLNFENVDLVMINGEQGRDVTSALSFILSNQVGNLELKLIHDEYCAPSIMIRFEIIDKESLDEVDNHFYDVFVSNELSADNLSNFYDLCRGYTSEKRTYAAAIGIYITGLITKERIPGAILPYEDYVSKLSEASQKLARYDSWLANSIRAIISFMLNDFNETESDNCLPQLRLARSFFRKKKCKMNFHLSENRVGVPIDLFTLNIIQYCLSSQSVREKLIRDIDKNHVEKSMGSKDRVKATYVLWEHYKDVDDLRSNELRRELTHSRYFNELIES